MSLAAVPDALILNALEQVAQYGTAPRGAAAFLDVGSAGFVDYFESEIIDDLLGSGGATCKMVAGAYGSGKTHLLDLLGDVALRRHPRRVCHAKALPPEMRGRRCRRTPRESARSGATAETAEESRRSLRRTRAGPR